MLGVWTWFWHEQPWRWLAHPYHERDLMYRHEDKGKPDWAFGIRFPLIHWQNPELDFDAVAIELSWGHARHEWGFKDND